MQIAMSGGSIGLCANLFANINRRLQASADGISDPGPDVVPGHDLSRAHQAMPLTLSVIRANRLPPGQQLSLTLERGSAVIGRAPQSDWVLHDPERIISGQHCVVEWREDGYYVTDTSRNGLYLNQSEERLGQGKEVKLKEGDELSLGEYDIRVSITRDPVHHLEFSDAATDVFDRSAILSALANAVVDPNILMGSGNPDHLDSFETPGDRDDLFKSLLAGAANDSLTNPSRDQRVTWHAGRRLAMAVTRLLRRFEAEELIRQFQRSSRAQALSDQQLADFQQWLTTLYPEAAKDAEEIFWYELRSAFHRTSSREP